MRVSTELSRQEHTNEPSCRPVLLRFLIHRDNRDGDFIRQEQRDGGLVLLIWLNQCKLDNRRRKAINTSRNRRAMSSSDRVWWAVMPPSQSGLVIVIGKEIPSCRAVGVTSIKTPASMACLISPVVTGRSA